MLFERDFENLTEDDITLLNEYFEGFDYQSSGHTFRANYIWRNTHNMSWQVIGDYLCVGWELCEEDGGKPCSMSFPLTRTGDYDIDRLKETLSRAKEIFLEKGMEGMPIFMPGSLLPYFKACYPDLEPEHERDEDDYIYLKEDLASLSGRKYHQKKNHLNYFLRNYEFTYEDATPEMVPEILDYVESKNEYKLEGTPEDWQEILTMENEAIEELVKFVGKGLLTGVIRVGGKIVAVTMGEFARADKETVIVHVEKADDRLRGLYQAINNEFVKRLPSETIYVNREEDMGLENLRKTKLSYKPVKMGEKYFVIVK